MSLEDENVSDYVQVKTTAEANGYDNVGLNAIEENGSVHDKEQKQNDADDEETEDLLTRQRMSLQQLLDQQAQSMTEGTLVNVIYAEWVNNLLNGDFKTINELKEKIGPIDTNGIVNENGIFCDYNQYPLYVLLPEIYEQLVNWYGITPHSHPVTTYVVTGPDGLLQPEFAKPSFYLHHLSTETTTSPHQTAYSSIPFFAISSLHTFNDLVQLAITKLDEKERISKHNDDFDNKRFRVWIITDDNLINLNYLITPKQFMIFTNKILIMKQYLPSQIKTSGLSHAHLIIEEKVIVNPTKKKSSENYWPSNYFIHHPPCPSDGTIGLQNLGNTCYMNSSLQCLVHIPEITQYFLFNCYEKELNQDNPLGMSGKVAVSFANLVHNLFEKKSDRSKSFTPREFKQTIGYFNSMFSGYHQQDSQEFLAFLLDGLHEDLNRIIKKPITEKPELNEKDSNNPEAIRQLAEKSWEQHKLRNDSIIIDLFTGMYKSTLICPDCSKISITFDPFSDLTLPLPVNNLWSAKILLFLEDGPIRQFEVELAKNSTYKSLKNYIAEKLALDANHLFACEIWSDQFYRNFESSSFQSGYLPIGDLISNNDLIVMYEVRHSKGDTIVPVLNTVLPDSGIPSAFGIPFFISLTEKEKESYGVIRKKLEHRYEQLSTFKFFSKSRSDSPDGFKATDGKESDVDIVVDNEDSGYSSDTSLDVSQISGEYAFKIKLFDASKQTKTRRKNYSFNRNRRYSGGVSRPDKEEFDPEELVWTPSTNNSFTKLPELLDFVEPMKKALYASKPATPNSEGPATVSDDLEKTGSISEIEELNDYVEVSPAEKERNAVSDTDSLDEQLTVLTDTLEEEKLSDSLKSDDKEIQIEVSPASASLIGKRTALVCEWDPELFDVFFSGLEEEGKGGINTWSNPEVLVNEEVEEAKRRREAEANKQLTLDQCLRLFSKAEVLGEQDLWYCSNCKEHREATKQIEIWSTPDILSIHLKRFENQRSFSDKIDAVVDFPIEGLNMSPFLAEDSVLKDQDDVLYDLFAVVNHYGGLGGGHYTSYVNNFVDNKWHYYDDSRVSLASPEKAITGAAYLLFYRKRSSTSLGGEKLVEMLRKSRDLFEAQQQQELENMENFYRQNKESSSEEESEEEEEEEQESRLDENETIEQTKLGYAIAPSPKISESDEESNSSDNVSSIPVGSDDEDQNSKSSRKKRVISRGARYNRLTDITGATQSDTESPVAISSNSTPSEDGSSYSPLVKIPGAYPSPNTTNSS